MIHAQMTKVLLLTAPADAIDSGGNTLTVDELDTLGWDYATLLFQFGDMGCEFATMEVTESDTSGSQHSAITGLIWGTSSDIAGDTSALPTQYDDASVFVADISLMYRKRYLDITMITNTDWPSGSIYVTILAILSRGSTAPTTATERGAGSILRV